MKKFLLTAILALIATNVFAQERIAVFPFEDMENILTNNQEIMFYREFSIEFANRNAGRFSIVPRLEVERLITTEFNFQLTVFSAQEKTAEMMRVQSATQILSGSIGTLNNEIRISVSLYTYPNLDQLPGGAVLSVSNTSELFNKIPELVESMYIAIADGVRPPDRTGSTPSTPTPNPAVSLSDQLVNATGTVTITVTQNTELPLETVISRASSITLRGDTANRTILGSSSNHRIKIERGVTLTLENITLRGVGIEVNAGGTLVMNNAATITGCTNIGVDVDGGTFIMRGGTISNNWGGVIMASAGTFTMSGGTISGNSPGWDGGGVCVYGNFTMSGGTISDNTARDGGGVYVSSYGTFTMSGGTISGNRASHGGGVLVKNGGTFRMTGGTIYGSNGGSNANRADGGILRLIYGHAVYDFNRTFGTQDLTIRRYN